MILSNVKPVKRIAPNTRFSDGHNSRTYAEPVMEILFIEATFPVDRTLRWAESIKIFSERRVMPGL